MNKFTYSIFAGMVVFGAAAFAAEQIPGVPRAENTKTSSGYASPSVKAELKINVNESTDKVTFVQDNTDPYVVTKVYKLKNVDPYILRLSAADGQCQTGQFQPGTDHSGQIQ